MDAATCLPVTQRYGRPYFRAGHVLDQLLISDRGKQVRTEKDLIGQQFLSLTAQCEDDGKGLLLLPEEEEPEAKRSESE